MDVTVELDFPEAGGTRLHLHAVRPSAQWQADSVAEVCAAIDRAQAQARAGRWVVGFVAFEAAPAFDPALRTRPAHATLPLAAFYAFDAVQVATPAHVARGAFECGPWRADDHAASVHAMVRAIQAQITAGTFYQVNASTRLRAAFAGDAGALYAQLVHAQPQAYCVRIGSSAWEIHSVSPELFFDWDGELLTSRPMKGTAPRFPEAERDQAAKAWLASSDKDRAENVMIVDLIRNDLSRVARIGSVHTPQLFTLEALPTAWQMTSTVQCRTRTGIGLSDVFAALFPCGSVTGAPKISAMQAIATLESSARGIYCGAVGVIRPGGHATFNVAIRTVCIDRVRGQAECGVGSGITIHSTGDGEHDEWMIKRRFLLRASAGFELLETMRLEDGAIWLWPEHLERLRRAANHFGFALDEPALADLETRLRAGHPRGVWRVRLLCTRDGSLNTEVAALDESPAQVTVQLAAAPVDSGEEFLRYKTTERALYAAHRPPQDVFDTLLWNERGELTEFTRGNVVFELDGRCVTPAAHCGLLPGAYRTALLRQGKIVEDVVRREDLTRCTRMWFINSVRGWLPARLQPPPARR